MTKEEFLKIRILFVVSVSLVLGALLLYQYFHEGIPNHHFLAREDMPKVSNVWGIISVPLMSWFLLWRVDKRIFRDKEVIPFPKNVLIAFIAALCFGVLLGLSILFKWNFFSGNIPLILFALALFFPTYRAEYFLGFILGLTYFVGGVLPIIVGCVFLLISAIVYLYLRTFVLWIFGKVIRN